MARDISPHDPATGGLRGVSQSGGKWVAKIGVHGKRLYLGLFDTPEEAHAEYVKAARKYFGEAARVDSDAPNRDYVGTKMPSADVHELWKAANSLDTTISGLVRSILLAWLGAYYMAKGKDDGKDAAKR